MCTVFYLECTGSVMFIVDVSPWESDAVHGTVKSISDALSSVGNSKYGSWITTTSSRSDNIRNVDLTKSLRNAFDTIWMHIGWLARTGLIYSPEG